MKKYLIPIILLCFVCTSWAGNLQKKVIARKNAVVSPCITMGASGTYKFWGNNDYAGDTDQACVNSGLSTIQGTTGSGETIDTWANFGIAGPTGGGTYGVKFDADNERISYVNTANDIIDTSEGTIALDIYLIASTGDNTFVTAYGDANNFMAASVNLNGRLYLRHHGNTVDVAMTGGDTVADATWAEVRISWSVTSNQISVKVGANDWDVDADGDAVTAFATAAANLFIGDGTYGIAIADGIYVDNFRVSGTYQDEAL